jgi:hypothetical protein
MTTKIRAHGYVNILSAISRISPQQEVVYYTSRGGSDLGLSWEEAEKIKAKVCELEGKGLLMRFQRRLDYHSYVFMHVAVGCTPEIKKCLESQGARAWEKSIFG